MPGQHKLETGGVGQRFKKHVEINADVSKSEIDWETHKESRWPQTIETPSP
jgi:hypothetical protein